MPTQCLHDPRILVNSYLHSMLSIHFLVSLNQLFVAEASSDENPMEAWVCLLVLAISTALLFNARKRERAGKGLR